MATVTAYGYTSLSFLMVLLLVLSPSMEETPPH
jgi:hypothetical protein